MTNEVHGLARTTGSRGTGFPLGNGEGANGKGAMDSEIGHSGAAERDGHWVLPAGFRCRSVRGPEPSSAGPPRQERVIRGTWWQSTILCAVNFARFAGQ